MSLSDTQTSGGEDTDTQSTANRARSALATRGRDGSLAMLAGGALLAWALVTRRKSVGRTALKALTGVTLLGLGRRQRRARRREEGIETEEDVQRTEGGEKSVSDEAYVEANRDLGAHRNAVESGSVYQSDAEPNPRGMTDRSDVQQDDGGDVDFVEGKEPGAHRETHLEGEGEQDTRFDPENDDEQVEVDLSEAAMADEVSEAVGPHPEQAYPAREGTDPEPTSDEAPPRDGEEASSTDAGGDAGEDADMDAEECRSDDEPHEESDESEESTD